MDASPFLDRIHDDEGLTSDLDEADAMFLVQALTECVRKIAKKGKDADGIHALVAKMCSNARKIARSGDGGATFQNRIRELVKQY